MNEFVQHHRSTRPNWLWLLIGAVALPAVTVSGGEYLSGITWPEPPIVTPGKTDQDPPSDAVVAGLLVSLHLDLAEWVEFSACWSPRQPANNPKMPDLPVLPLRPSPQLSRTWFGVIVVV